MKLRHYVMLALLAGIWIYKMIIAPVMVSPQRGMDGNSNPIGGESFADYGASASEALFYSLIASGIWLIFFVIMHIIKRKR